MIANNVVENAYQSYALNNGTALPATFTNCILANNLCVNSTIGFDLIGNTTTQNLNNIVLSAAVAATKFTKYAAGDTSNDYHLLPAASDLVNKGTDLAAYFTTDKDGIVRPQGAAWDIGAYEYTTNKIQNPKYQIPNVSTLLLPNPIKAAAFKEYLQNQKDVVLYDLTGNRINKASLASQGIYFVRAGTNSVVQKITVIQ
jgi:hypothetical protein